MNAPEKFDESTLRTPPHSIEMEQAVLGALMLQNDAIDFLEGLKASHFYRYDHRIIFEHIGKLIYAMRPADVVTVYEALCTSGKEKDIGGLAYLNALVQSTPSAANIRHYAEIVINRWKMRGVITAADEIAADAFNPQGKEVDTVIAEAQTKLEHLTDLTSDSPRLAAETIGEVINDLDVQYHSDGQTVSSTVVPTGFADLDERLDGGARGGELIVVAGRPGMGKTAFALRVGSSIARRGDPVLVDTIEMPAKQLNRRLLAELGDLPLAKMKDGSKLQHADWPKVTHAVQLLTEMPIYIDESGTITVHEIVSRARAMKRKVGLRMLIIDYLGLIKLGNEERHDLKIGAVTRALKELAKQLDIPVILLAQLNRGLEQRPNKRPLMADLRDSGAIEQDADIILFLYRDEVYNPDTADKGIAEVIIGKQRDGATGKVGLGFTEYNAKFTDLASGTLFGQSTSRSSNTKRGFDE
ncbi:replicative DNA helicase [Paraburkholderia sp.]|uniref:replicative DNA helicase n=1 Tax=Paraburkholderia sp. TaxID=1926495 RepID=UPI003C7E496E